MEVEAPPVIMDLIKAREAVLSFGARATTTAGIDLDPDPPRDLELQERWHAAIRADSVEQYGIPLAGPECTIIIPLYQRIDFFVEHQLVQFAHGMRRIR